VHTHSLTPSLPSPASLALLRPPSHVPVLGAPGPPIHLALLWSSFLAISQVLLFLGLLGFVPVKGLGTPQLPCGGARRETRAVAGSRSLGGRLPKEPRAGGRNAQGLAFQGSPLGESSRGLVQENGPNQRTKSVFLHT